jgi:hypothetical protein
VALENEIVVADIYANGGTYVSRVDLPVEVKDGRLTMTLGGNGQITSTKVSCLEIYGYVLQRPEPRGRPRDVTPAVDPPLRDAFELAAGLSRGSTRMLLELRRTAPVRLAVHDVRGRRVAVLHDGPLAAGRHAFDWDPRDRQGERLASGVYFVRVQSPVLEASRKLVLVR